MFFSMLIVLYVSFALILFLALFKPSGYSRQNVFLACCFLTGGVMPAPFEPLDRSIFFAHIAAAGVSAMQPVFLLALFRFGFNSDVNIVKQLKSPALVCVIAVVLDILLFLNGKADPSLICSLVASLFVHGFVVSILWPQLRVKNLQFYKKNKSLLGFVVIYCGFSAGGVVYILGLTLFTGLLNVAIDLSFLLKVFSLFCAIVITMRDVKGFKSISDLHSVGEKVGANVNPSHIEKLERLVVDEKVYLEAGLTVESLAEKMSISQRTLSTILNGYYQCNFFEFINKYRIEEAKRLLRSESYRHLTVLNVMYDAGFNSKATFNSMFKKVEGITPREYKKRCLTLVG